MTKFIGDLLKEKRMTTGGDTDSNKLEGLHRLIVEYFPADAVVAEIGSFEGASTELFALTCAHVYSIDPYDKGAYIEQEGLDNLKAAEDRFLNRMRYYQYVDKIKESSLEAAKFFPDGNLDAVYIDGDHRFESVIADLQAWVPKVKDGGIIAGHDYYGHIAQAIATQLGVPHKVYPDSSWVFRKGAANPRQFKIVECRPGDDFGFFANFYQALGVVAKERNENTEVLIDFRENENYRDDSVREPNIWERYFEQPSRYCVYYVLDDIEKGRVKNYQKGVFTEHCHYFGFHNGSLDWDEATLRVAQDAFKNNIAVKQHILDKVDAFYAKHMAGKKVLGVQRRGTDLWTTGHARGQDVFSLDQHFAAIDAKLCDFDSLLLVTDEELVLREFRARYQDRLIHYDDAILSRDGRAIHKVRGQGYKKGEDVLIEALLLSKCDFLLAMSSNISAAARVFNRDIQCEFVDKHIYYK